MAKRTSLKGRGADIFLGSTEERVKPAESYTSTPARQRAGIYPKATYYLPPDLQERLEDVWMQKRKSNRKLTKSDVVRQALEAYLSRQE